MTGIRADVSLEEAGGAMDAPAATAADLKLEGDAIPEQYRGKSVADVLKMVEATTGALRISEEARKTAEASREPVTREVIREVAPAAVVDERLTKEQLATLFESDPISAVGYMTDIAAKDATRQVEARLAPLAIGAANNAEAAAKAQFKDEFELFGPEIKEMTALIAKNPGGKEYLGTPAAWEQAISYVRGKTENLEKLIAHRVAKTSTAAAEAARIAQEGRTGYSPTPTRGSADAGKVVGSIPDSAGLDETQRKIADTFIAQGVFKSYAEYAKWDKLGS